MYHATSGSVLGAKYIAAAFADFLHFSGVLCWLITRMRHDDDSKRRSMERTYAGNPYGIRVADPGQPGLDNHPGKSSCFSSLAWTSVIATGFLAIIVFQNGIDQFADFHGIVFDYCFFVLNGIVEYVYNLFARYELLGIHKGLYIGIAEYGFYIVVCVGLFAISSVLAEKKLSV